ncbi:MAG: hypothetical protein ACLGXA_15955 [Acidobacteriota bacterium]
MPAPQESTTSFPARITSFLAFSAAANPALLIDGLGKRFEITRTNIRKWPVGSPIQAALDALQAIREQHPFRADQVRQVVVHLGTVEAGTVNNREMPNVSLQQMTALMLVQGTVSFHASHDRALVSAPSLVREREKVRLVPDAALQELYPQLVAVVEVMLRDGSHWTQRIDHVRGTAQNPMSTRDVADKARDLMEPRLGAARTAHLIETVLDLEALRDLRTLRPLLRPTPA